MTKRLGSIATACAVASLAVVAAGCGSSNSDSSSSGSSSSSSAPVATSPILAAAEKTVVPIDSTAAGKADAGGTAAKPTGKTIGFLDVVGGLDSTVRIKAALTAATKALGWTMIYCDGQGDPTKTSACATSLLSRNVDALISDGVDGSVIASQLRAFKAKGIPAIDVSGITPGYQANYSGSEVLQGQILALYFQQQLSGLKPTPVNIAASTYAAPWAVARTAALKNVVKNDSNLKIVTTASPDPANLIEGSRKQTTDQLTANPNIRAFWADFDSVGQVVGQVVNSKYPGKSFPNKPLVGTFHADAGTNKLMHQGAIDVVADYNYDMSAWVGVDQLAQLFAKKTPLSPKLNPNYGPEAGDLYTYQIVTKANVPPAGQLPTAKVNAPEFFGAKWAAEFGGS
jgi:ABC-type sugar transport system substrate-binding protein